MTMNVTDKTWLVAVWHYEWGQTEARDAGNFVMWLFRERVGEPLQIKWRHRIYQGTEIFFSNDQFYWYESGLPEGVTELEAIKEVGEICEDLRRVTPAAQPAIDFHEIFGNGQKLLELNVPWMHPGGVSKHSNKPVDC